MKLLFIIYQFFQTLILDACFPLLNILALLETKDLEYSSSQMTPFPFIASYELNIILEIWIEKMQTIKIHSYQLKSWHLKRRKLNCRRPKLWINSIVTLKKFALKRFLTNLYAGSEEPCAAHNKDRVTLIGLTKLKLFVSWENFGAALPIGSENCILSCNFFLLFIIGCEFQNE